MGWFDWLDRCICASHYREASILQQTIDEKDATIANLEATLHQTASELALYKSSESELQALCRDLQAQKENLLNQVGELNKELKELQMGGIPEDVAELIDKYNKKYPWSVITYNGRYWGNNPQNRYELDVRVFAQAGMNDQQLIDHVRNAKATVQQIMAENPNLTFHQACDEAVLRVARATPLNYYYDYQTYNATEFWAFSFETWHTRRGDCDDWSHLRHVLYRIAGVPAGLLRVVCGDTKGNLGGHCSNYYLASDKKFYHINSTSNIYSRNDWKDKDDPNDKMGIGDVWFSYNDVYSWSKFVTDAAEKSYFKEKDRLTKHITIHRTW
jgi:hypothetical protein